MPDSETIATVEPRKAKAKVSAPVAPAKMSAERICEIYGGPLCKSLAIAKKELSRVEEAIAKDGLPRLHNHISAKQRIDSIRKQIETLASK